MFDTTKKIIKLNKKKGNMAYGYSLDKERKENEKETKQDMRKGWKFVIFLCSSVIAYSIYYIFYLK